MPARWCPACLQVRTSHRHEVARPTAAQRGYGGAWQRRRAAFLRDNHECADCGADATEVDHITPRAWGGSDERDNLQALCKSCHSRKTAQQSGGLQ